MSLYQLFTPLLAIIIIIKIYSEFKRGKRTFRELIVRTFIWWGIGVVGYAPVKIVSKISIISGFESGINALIFFALVSLFYITFRIINSLDNLEAKINRLVREIAIKDSQDKIKDNRE